MGVTKEVLREGDGTNFPTEGQKLTMHYLGTLASNGSKFDSSYDRGTPFQFNIGKGEVIQGWDEGGKHIVGYFTFCCCRKSQTIFYLTASISHANEFGRKGSTQHLQRLWLWQ